MKLNINWLDNDNELSFICKDGREVIIKILDEMYRIEVQDVNSQPIGALEFSSQEVGDYSPDVLKLCWAHLEGQNRSYLRQGIGTYCIHLAKEYWGLHVYAEQDTGIRNNDGSHLTGDAPAWVQSWQ